MLKLVLRKRNLSKTFDHASVKSKCWQYTKLKLKEHSIEILYQFSICIPNFFKIISKCTYIILLYHIDLWYVSTDVNINSTKNKSYFLCSEYFHVFQNYTYMLYLCKVFFSLYSNIHFYIHNYTY